jgi:hypothetical protein
LKRTLYLSIPLGRVARLIEEEQEIGEVWFLARRGVQRDTPGAMLPSVYRRPRRANRCPLRLYEPPLLRHHHDSRIRLAFRGEHKT